MSSNIRVIITPSGVELPQIADNSISSDDPSPKLILLPHPRTSEPVKYLYSQKDSALYELRKITGANPHLKQSQKLELDNGDAIKSILIEPSETSEADNIGMILSDPSVYTFTPFNIIYTLILFFSANPKKYSERYVSFEDLEDSFSESSFRDLPSTLIAPKLELVCETIEEGGEKYFKFSSEKMLSFLREKTEKLSQSFPISLFNKVVLPKIAPAEIDDKIDSQIIESAKKSYSIDLMGSYLSQTNLGKLRQSYEEELAPLTVYLKKQKEIQKKKAAAQAHMDELTQGLTKEKGKKPQAKKTVKKPVKKVTRGAIDSFFKKK